MELVQPATEKETLLLGVLLNSFWAMMFVGPKGPRGTTENVSKCSTTHIWLARYISHFVMRTHTAQCQTNGFTRQV